MMTSSASSSFLTVHIEATFQEYNAKNTEPSPYVWMYRAMVKNTALQTITLKGRSWAVVTGDGITFWLNDPGIFQDVQVLSPGEELVYVGWIALHTASGLVYGQYLGSLEHKATIFPIPAFSLDSMQDTALLH